MSCRATIINPFLVSYESEQDASHYEGEDDVEALCGQEGPQRLAVLFGENLFEACLQADAYEGNGEEDALEVLGQGFVFHDVAVNVHAAGEPDAEHDRGDNHTDHELGEALPDDGSGGLLHAFGLAQRPVEGDEEGGYRVVRVRRAGQAVIREKRL